MIMAHLAGIEITPEGVRFDKKCGKSGIGEGEKCGKGAATVALGSGIGALSMGSVGYKNGYSVGNLPGLHEHPRHAAGLSNAKVPAAVGAGAGALVASAGVLTARYLRNRKKKKAERR